MEGYLQKKSSGGGLVPKRFQRRYFRVQGNYLKYSESAETAEESVKGVISLGDIQEVSCKGTAGEIALEFKPPAEGEKQHPDLILKAGDLSSAQEWVQCLEMAVISAASQTADPNNGDMGATNYSDDEDAGVEVLDAADSVSPAGDDPNAMPEPVVMEPVVVAEPEPVGSPNIEPVTVNAVTVDIKKMQLDKLVHKGTAHIQSSLKLESECNRGEFLDTAAAVLDRFQELRVDFIAPLQLLMHKGHQVPMDRFDRTLAQILGPLVKNPELMTDARQRKELQEAMQLYYKNVKQWDVCTDKKCKMLMQEDYLVWQERLLDHSRQEVLLVNTMQYSPFESQEEVEKYIKEPEATLVSVAKMFADERGLLIKEVASANDQFESSLEELEALDPAAEPPTDAEEAEGVLATLDDMQRMNESSRRAFLLWQLAQQSDELLKSVRDLMSREQETQAKREKRVSEPFQEWANVMQKLRVSLQDAINKAQRHFELMTEDLEDRVKASEKRQDKLAQMETVSLELGVGQQMARDQQEIKELQSDVSVLKAKVEALQERRAGLLAKLKPLLMEVNMVDEPQESMHTPMEEGKFEDWLKKLTVMAQ
jgi:hypothetical protein